MSWYGIIAKLLFEASISSHAVQVTLTGGAEHPAKIVGFDEDRDVAVLQLVTTEGEAVSALPLLHWVVIHCHKRKFKKLLHLPLGSLTSTSYACKEAHMSRA